MKVYVTKWLGVIKEMDGEWWAIEDKPGGRKWFRSSTGDRPWDYVLLDQKHVHLDYASAVRAAEKLRNKRVASLLKQVEKLEALTFDKVDRG